MCEAFCIKENGKEIAQLTFRIRHFEQSTMCLGLNSSPRLKYKLP